MLFPSSFANKTFSYTASITMNSVHRATFATTHPCATIQAQKICKLFLMVIAFAFTCIGLTFINIGNCTIPILNTKDSATNYSIVLLTNRTSSIIPIDCCYGTLSLGFLFTLIFTTITTLWPLSEYTLNKLNTRYEQAHTQMNRQLLIGKTKTNKCLLCFFVMSLFILPTLLFIAFEKCQLFGSVSFILLFCAILLIAITALSIWYIKKYIRNILTPLPNTLSIIASYTPKIEDIETETIQFISNVTEKTEPIQITTQQHYINITYSIQ